MALSTCYPAPALNAALQVLTLDFRKDFPSQEIITEITNFHTGARCVKCFEADKMNGVLIPKGPCGVSACKMIFWMTADKD